MSGIEIPNGAVATYVGVWSASLSANLLGGNDITNVGRQLLDDGLTITSSDTSNTFFVLFGGTYTVTLQILNQSGQELDDTDLVQQVADAVNIVTGSPPTSGAVTQVFGPDSGQNTGTAKGVTTPAGAAVAAAAAAANPSAVHQCGDPSWSWYQDIPQFFECLTQKGLTTMGLLFIGLLIGIVLIVAAPRVTRP